MDHVFLNFGNSKDHQLHFKKRSPLDIISDNLVRFQVLTAASVMVLILEA
jgi:hypothetical protein